MVEDNIKVTMKPNLTHKSVPDGKMRKGDLANAVKTDSQ